MLSLRYTAIVYCCVDDLSDASTIIYIISSLASYYVFISVPVCVLFVFTLIQHEYNINLDLYRGIQFELYSVTMNIRSEILQ